MEHTLSGKIEDYNGLSVGGRWITDFMEDFVGAQIKLSYFLSKSEKPLESIEELLLKESYEGKVSVYNEYIGNNEIDEWEDEMLIGERDILEELRAHEGKYVVIKVEV